MTYRYETEILSHIVTIRRSAPGRHEISIHGASVSKRSPRTYLTLHEAKAEAHAFAHSALEARCECDGIEWGIVADE